MTTKKVKSHPKKFGVAVSMAAAAGRTGLSVSSIQAAKHAGCPAIKQQGRVDCDELIEWLAAHPEVLEKSDKIDKGLEQALSIRAERMIREHRLQILKGRFITRAEAGQRIATAGAKIKSILEDRCTPEVADEILEEIRKLCDGWEIK